MRLRLDSLAFRLVAGAAIWSVVALVAAGIILTSLYRSTVERAFDERVDVYLKTLIGVLATQRPEPTQDPGNLGEPRFEQLYSGWYWQVRKGIGGPVILASKSLFTDELAPTGGTPIDGETGAVRAAMVGPEEQSLRLVQRDITFGQGDEAVPYQILVAGNATELRGQINAFRNSVILTLAVFGVGLLIATFFQIRWGIRPLDSVRSGLADLRSGKETRFEGRYPAEIQPLIHELNALLRSNQEIIERARTQVGNLAHALKTPLSVITNEARSADGPLAEKVAEQAELMRVQVTHYLDRARIAARSQVIGAVTPVGPVMNRLCRAMNRIYAEKGVSLSSRTAPGALFRGEQQDLEEIIGNLADNACKWARTSVSVDILYDKPAGDHETGRLTVNVDDDGPGLTPEQRAEATRRGKRLDESKPGSGLGLSIVTDLVALYGGSFRLDTAPGGGLRAEVVLPAA